MQAPGEVRQEPGEDAARDAELARRVAAGDTGAEGELCARLLPRVRVWARLRTRDESRSADLAQEVLVTVLQSLRERRVREIDRIAAFVAGVCARTWLAWQRGEQRRGALLERYGASFESAALFDDAPLDLGRLAECFHKLAPRARSVLALTFFSERSGDEIAVELRTSAGAVRVARHRALGDLHRCMEGSA